jgi:CRP/FNR family transcriptional regulator, cyclic AMP receptor protein
VRSGSRDRPLRFVGPGAFAKAMSDHLPDQKRIRALLKGNTFLGRFPDAALDALLAKGKLKRLAKDAAAYRHGDPGNSLMVLTAGRIKLSRTITKEVVLHFVSVGEVFGELAALDGKERAVDAVATESSEVFVIYRRDLLPTLALHPQAMLEIIGALCARLRTGATAFDGKKRHMPARAAVGLIRLAEQFGRRRKGCIHLELNMSREQLGAFLDLSRSNVSRALVKLQEKNVIAINKTEIIIIDEEGLEAIAEADTDKK